MTGVVCKSCEVELPASAFWAHRQTKSGLWGKCKKCVQAARRARYTPAEPIVRESVQHGMKRCSTCKSMKTRQEFYRRSDTPDNLCYSCKKCTKSRPRNNTGIAFNEARRDKKWAAHLRRNFGMTTAEYDDLFGRQGGLCAICCEPEQIVRNGRRENLCVDHCHDTGVIRGLLCRKCNRSIGQLGDTADRLRSALSYLEKCA